jgi:hypothetical protein
MRKIIIITILGVIAVNILLTSCVDCIEGNDRIVEQERVFNNLYFDEVINNGNFYVEIIQSNHYKVSVKADDNVLPYINTYIQGTKIVIESKSGKCYNTTKTPTVYLSTPALNYVELNGSGEIYCDQWIDNTLELDMELSGSGNIFFNDLNVKRLNANISGSGTIDLSGTAETGDLAISGSGKIKAFSFLQNQSLATISGSGNIYTFFYDLLDVVISGSGNVFYKGDSRYAKWKITGSGSVINSNK